jgi:hypothetical protein
VLLARHWWRYWPWRSRSSFRAYPIFSTLGIIGARALNVILLLGLLGKADLPWSWSLLPATFVALTLPIAAQAEITPFTAGAMQANAPFLDPVSTMQMPDRRPGAHLTPDGGLAEDGSWPAGCEVNPLPLFIADSQHEPEHKVHRPT